MSGPFKMKGSPMQRNFGIGSPAKHTEGKVHVNPHPKEKMSQAMKDKIAATKAENIKETNILLAEQGKPLVSLTSLD